MSIRILAIEDDANFLETLQSMLSDLGSDVSVQVGKSRDSGLEALRAESFDIIILDLKLPTVDGSLDEDAEHGRFLLHEAQKVACGTPVVVLTGSPAESFIANFLQYSEQVDIWGDDTKTPTINFFRKSDLDEIPRLLKPWVESIRMVRDIEIRAGVNLTWEEDRLVRIFVRRRGGVSCTVHRIGGGLSGASVLRVAICDASGAPILHAIMKVADADTIAKECSNYNKYAQRLLEKATPRMFEEIRFGGGSKTAITYRVAEEFESDLFRMAAVRPQDVADMVVRTAELIEPWRQGVVESRSTIGDVRKRLVSDQKAIRLSREFSLEWMTAFERRQVQLRWCPIHGDLHGANVLVDTNGVPIIIDYGDVSPGPSALDWITLELSSIFHVDGCARDSGWPSEVDCEEWPDVASFAARSPVRPFIEAARRAAEIAGVGRRELGACAYAYLVRQLSYGDTDKKIAVTLLERIRRFVEDET